MLLQLQLQLIQPLSLQPQAHRLQQPQGQAYPPPFLFVAAVADRIRPLLQLDCGNSCSRSNWLPALLLLLPLLAARWVDRSVGARATHARRIWPPWPLLQ